MTTTDLLFSAGALSTIASFMMLNVLYLRSLIILGSAFYITGALIAGLQNAGMKSTIIFSILYASINLVQIVIIFLNKSPVFIPDEVKEVFFKVFYTMTPRQFLKLYKLSTIKSIKKNECLTIQNKPVENLMVILEGSVNVLKENKVITKIGPGFFIGEMSFLSNEMATATVIADSQVKYMEWNRKILLRLEHKDPTLAKDLKHIVALNLIKKLEVKPLEEIIEP